MVEEEMLMRKFYELMPAEALTKNDYIQGIKTAYTKDFTNKDITKRQIAVATYLIDKLALRAGNEKLNRETKGGDLAEKVVVYQHANKELLVLILLSSSKVGAPLGKFLGIGIQAREIEDIGLGSSGFLELQKEIGEDLKLAYVNMRFY
ncbi:DNA topoisomerase 1 beta [Camellia lanceoleosa]|uniref:DNA topoisomerase 1 beta n=1 Tax=Camellia lanceoleosa TaxID=1840588 RepID=A0ACC0F926_9ERIC|nr:DNA topoisomerase 1 beta [Camellia lanceoleosa]